MPRGINQIQAVFMSIRSVVMQPDTLSLNRNPALALQIHRVQHLRLHLPLRKRPSKLQQTVCKRRFPMVNMRDNAKISDEAGIHRFLTASALSLLNFSLWKQPRWPQTPASRKRRPRTAGVSAGAFLSPYRWRPCRRLSAARAKVPDWIRPQVEAPLMCVYPRSTCQAQDTAPN